MNKEETILQLKNIVKPYIKNQEAFDNLNENTDFINDLKINSANLVDVILDIEEAFNNNELDYGRKLYLIENCIYGVDIQPIATQISKLLFFISLVVDQKVYAAKSLVQKGGFVSMDKINDRVENEFWKFQVDNFQSWMVGFYKFEAEWKTTEIEKNNILVEYTYILHSTNPLYYPLNWLFAKIFWKIFF